MEEMTADEHLQFLELRIELLEHIIKKQSLIILANDPNFDKPLSEIETIFEIIKPK